MNDDLFHALRIFLNRTMQTLEGDSCFSKVNKARFSCARKEKERKVFRKFTPMHKSEIAISC